MATDDHQPFKRPKTSSSSTTTTTTRTPTPSTAGGLWGELPGELLFLILQKLILQDHLRFSRVCVSWNLAVRGGGGGGCRPIPKPQLPWLMIAGGGRHPTSATFISLSERRAYDIPLPQPPIQQRLCVGSSHGWLITLHNHKRTGMHLLNPITGVQVRLPAITTTIPAATRSHKKYGDFFGKAILSSAPSRDGTGDFTVFLIRGMPMKRRTLAVTRIGDDAWTTFGHEFIVDIMYHKGQLYIMGVQGCIHIWEQQQHHHHLSFVHRFTIDTRDFHHNNIPLKLAYHKKIGSPFKHYVQSTTGELFMLIRTKNRARGGIRFLIARLDLDRNEYVPVDDLNDLVFFTGMNDPIVVSATKFPEVKKNRVYFTESYFVRTFGIEFGVQPLTELMKITSSPSNSFPSCDIGVYDMENKEHAEFLDNIGFRRHLSLAKKKFFHSLFLRPPATWITPTAF